MDSKHAKARKRGFVASALTRALKAVQWWYQPNIVTRTSNKVILYGVLSTPILILGLTRWAHQIPFESRLVMLFAGAVLGSVLLAVIYAKPLSVIFEGFYAKLAATVLGFAVIHIADSWSDAFISGRMQSSASLFHGMQDIVTAILLIAITMALLLILIFGISVYTFSGVSEVFRQKVIQAVDRMLLRLDGVPAPDANLEIAERKLVYVVLTLPFRLEHYRKIAAVAGAACIFVLVTDGNWSKSNLRDFNLETLLEWAVVSSAFEENEIPTPRVNPASTRGVDVRALILRENVTGQFAIASRGIKLAGIAPRRRRCLNLKAEQLVAFVNPNDLAPADVVVAVPLTVGSGTAEGADLNYQWGYRLYDFYRVACINSAAIPNPPEMPALESLN